MSGTKNINGEQHVLPSAEEFSEALKKLAENAKKVAPHMPGNKYEC